MWSAHVVERRMKRTLLALSALVLVAHASAQQPGLKEPDHKTYTLMYESADTQIRGDNAAWLTQAAQYAIICKATRIAIVGGSDRAERENIASQLATERALNVKLRLLEIIPAGSGVDAGAILVEPSARDAFPTEPNAANPGNRRVDVTVTCNPFYVSPEDAFATSPQNRSVPELRSNYLRACTKSWKQDACTCSFEALRRALSPEEFTLFIVDEVTGWDGTSQADREILRLRTYKSLTTDDRWDAFKYRGFEISADACPGGPHS